eukprot:c20619_g1_i1 orf=66-482(+)
MDYSLAALKLLIGHLKALPTSLPPPSSSASATPHMALGNLLFQRAWLQGVLVPGLGSEHKLLDDGSGVIELIFSKEFQEQQWKPGMYVLVLGAYIIINGNSMLKVHKIVDLSSSPDREAMWNMEVIEAYNLFYAKSVQ